MFLFLLLLFFRTSTTRDRRSAREDLALFSPIVRPSRHPPHHHPLLTQVLEGVRYPCSREGLDIQPDLRSDHLIFIESKH
ncbi:hypothetical protein BGZ57DRAFT_896173 [Hyaloscypha finlandica]|nr:hypothetical protein BGZ57DRAFT_896173 [Hyaloscypha finlandica]